MSVRSPAVPTRIAGTVPPRALGAPRRTVLLVVVLASIGLLSVPPAGATTTQPGFVEETLTFGTLSGPTAVALAPDGRMFVTEKAGLVRVVLPNGTVRSTPLLDLRNRVNSYSDRGLLGIATDKDFAVNGYLYLLYVYELQPGNPDSSAPMVSRLTRVTVSPDNTLANPSAPEAVILGKDVSGPCPLPDNARDCIPADFYWHTIGTVISDPVDGTLWLGSGDAHPSAVDATSYLPYDERSFAGKIIHIDRNGLGLPDHPFCPNDTDLTHTCTKIYAEGFRNPFRFTLRPGAGPVVGDVGNSHQEELDLVQPGLNYGWPCYEGTIKTPLYDQEQRCQQEYAKEGTADAAAPPAWSYAHGAGAAIVAGPVYQGSGYPAGFTGDIFVGDYVQGWVKRLDVDSSDRVVGVSDFATDWPTGVDMKVMPGSGDLVYVDLGWGAAPAAVRRFRFTDTVNAPPTARASATPTSGPAPLTVRFQGTASTDPDGDQLSYSWDFGDGSALADGADPEHTYTADGSYTATLTVDDGSGGADRATVEISVGNSPPNATITAPTEGSTFRAGEAVLLTASATDAEDGALPDTAYSWHVLLHHATHIHDLTSRTGATTSFVPTTDHDADSYYEIRLTVTDSGGLQDHRTVTIDPETVNLTFASDPPGATISYADGEDRAAPFVKVAAVGFRAAISAAPSFVKNGVTYAFQRWSDGGAATHTISVPAIDSTYTATYEPSQQTSTFTLRPVADAQVREVEPSRNFGTWNLRVDGGADADVESYLRFDVPAGIGTVTSATLRLFASSGTVDGPAVYASGTGWTESGITWSNRPARIGGATDDKGSIAANTWVEYDVTSLIGGSGVHSFVLAGTSTDGIDMYSRESATNPPELILRFSGSAPADTSPPTSPTLSAKVVSASRVDLSWTAAMDNVGVTRYELSRRVPGQAWTVVSITTSAVRTYSDTGLAAATAYEYQVRAFDAAGNSSASAVVRVKTRRR